jgi:archaemetzincin
LILEIVTVGKTPKNLARRIGKEIKWIYSAIIDDCIIGPSIDMPPLAYSKSRKQYNADIILDAVRHGTADGRKILAVLDVDLYTSSRDLNFIFGQAQLGGKVAVVSLHRLNQKFYNKKEDSRLFFERAVKEAVHEVGHAFGIGHCTDTYCVMCFSNSISDVDEKGIAPCQACRGKLQRIFTMRVSR